MFTIRNGGFEYDYSGSRSVLQRPKESLRKLMVNHSRGSTARTSEGVILSGGARIQSQAYRDLLIRACSEVGGGPIIGGEMEGAGFLAVSPFDNPKWLVVKAISDFADGAHDKPNPENRRVACEAAAQFVLEALVLDDPLEEEKQ